MKKLYVLFALLLSSGIAFSQIAPDRAVVLNKKQLPASMIEKAATDTCGWSMNFIPEFAVGGQVTTMVYQSLTWATNCGYVFGNNYDGYDICAQGYVYVGYIGIEGTLLMFAGKIENDPAATMTVTAYAMNGIGKNDADGDGVVENGPGPGTVLGQSTLALGDADTNFTSLTWVPFASVLPSNGDFAVAVDFSGLNGAWDTLADPSLLSGNEAGLFCDAEGEANQLDYAFLKVGTTWYTYDYGFGGLDRNIAIFPVVDIAYAGINDDSYFYGMQSNSYPNPAADVMTIEYALENNAEVTIEIISDNGKTISEVAQGNQSAGVHSYQMNVNDLSAGHYFFSIRANGHRLIKSFMVN